LEFYFWFWCRPFRHNLHVIPHHAAEFRPNLSTHCGNMRSCPFLKMAAASATAKYYFRFRICWCYCLQKGKVYQQTKFHRHISFDGRAVTTSVFEKQTSAILEFYFRFRSRPLRSNLQVLYFPHLGGSPHHTDSTQKLHGGWCPRHNHVCQVSNWYLHALRFYRGQIFLLIFAWALQQCSANALPVICCGNSSTYQSAATSKIAKHFCSRVVWSVLQPVSRLSLCH